MQKPSRVIKFLVEPIHSGNMLVIINVKEFLNFLPTNKQYLLLLLISIIL